MENCERTVSRRLAVLVGIMALSAGSRALAFPNGVSTMNFGPQGCNQCHSGGQAPTVTLMGPTTVDPSSTNEYSLVIDVIGSQTSGGLNVSDDFGTLAIGGSNAAQTQTTSAADGRTEITHMSPKPASGGAISFSFLWTAPGSFTSTTLRAWGNAVNLNGSSTGDRASFTSLTIVSSKPGPNPTATPTPTPVATSTPVLHDVVVAAVKPLNVNIAAGATAVTKNLSVKVTNADPKGTVGTNAQLSVTNGCPAGVTVGPPTFGGVPGLVFLKSGQSKAAKVPVSIASDAFATLNHTAAGRCALTFSAVASPESIDTNPSNNTVTAEINVTDKNDPDQTTAHESFIQSLTPLKITIPPASASIVKQLKLAVGNADILPVPENPGDAISITASDGDCPAGTVGTATPATVTVKGGKKRGVALTITIDATQFATANAKSPARCTAEVTATGPSDPDPDPSNNTTRLVIDVVEKQ